MFEKSALDCWSEEAKDRPIITLCKTLDKWLGGGILPKVITELCGAPGSGKTQVCLQLCVNVQFPREVGGVGGGAIFVDTNQGFSPHRLNDISNYCADRCQQTYKKFYKKQIIPTNFDCSSIMSNVSYIYCMDYIELLTTIEKIKCILASDNNVKLIVVDSFSFLFRSFDNITDRTRIVYEILTDLQVLADQYELAIVVTSELTTRINNNEAIVCPALGDSLAHKVGQRIILSKQNDQNHVAFLAKCLFSGKIGIPFKIKESGIRGFD